MSDRVQKPLRSVLYVPASNAKAMAKIGTLVCDAVIIDLEDAVMPESKVEARDRLASFMQNNDRPQRQTIIRINALSGQWGNDDLRLARGLEPDGILLPKVDTPRDVLEAGDMLDDEAVPDTVRLWVMIETPRALLNIGAIAELGRDPASRLAVLVAGTNDLAKETGVAITPDRQYFAPWLTQIVLAARAGGLVALDGVMNQFSDPDAFERECAQGAAMGFDGKTLIHPAQIAAAESAFSPSAEALATARRVIASFALAENVDKGVIVVDGRMTERLHLAQAERIVARASAS